MAMRKKCTCNPSQSTKKANSLYNRLQYYSKLLHPMRLLIIDILQGYHYITRLELEKYIGGKRGTFETHVKVLHKEGLIKMRDHFINAVPQKIICISPKGTQHYREFRDLMMQIIKIK